MKKFIVLVIIFELLLIVCSVIGYLFFVSDETMIAFVELLKIVFQSTLTGTVTFLGLFFTILSQEHQNKTKERKELCPCIIVKKTDSLTAKRDISSVKETSNTIISTADQEIRTVDCVFCNCKNNYCLNLCIQERNKKILLGSVKDAEFKLSLALSSTDGVLTFYFEDIYGVKYKQKIAYTYSVTIRNELQFISKQPERIKKNVIEC